MSPARGFATALLLACALPGGGAERPQVERKAIRMDRLSDEALRACQDPGSAVALVRVRAVELHAPGTRSEHVIADLDVERALCGSPPPALKAWSFTSKGALLVAEGRRYVMAVLAAQGYARFGIGDRVEVPPGREDEAVELHRKALAALAATKP